MPAKKLHMSFLVLGAMTAILEQPAFNGVLRLPQALYLAVPSLMFSVPLTVCAMLFRRSGPTGAPSTVRYVLAALSLTVGMPVAFIAGALSLAPADRIFPGATVNWGGIGFPFFLAEIVSCVVWSAALLTWSIIVNKPQGRRLFGIALLLTLVVMLISNLIAGEMKILSERDVLLPIISIGEQSISGLILAIGMMQHRAD